MKKDIIEEIKSRGYWRIVFEPTVYETKLSSVSECREVVEKCVVSLRGWDFPHLARRNDSSDGYQSFENYFQSWTDWESYKELWRMYQSGQFIFYKGLNEDWHEKESIDSGTKFNIIGSGIYQLTEVYEFLNRLVSFGLYNEGVSVNVSLQNTSGRKLWLSDPMRTGFWSEYKTGADKIEFAKTYTKEDILNTSKDISLENMLYVVDRFGWSNPAIETLAKDRDNLLTGRI